MNKAEIAIHLHYKKKIANYPKLPKQLFKKGKARDNGLIESCLLGFRKRLSNWLEHEAHALLYVIHEPKPIKEEVVEEPIEEVDPLADVLDD